ncbi:hypothetical protein SUDANB95_04885 [Actinosynnema sp. ALI-1.44]
MRAHLNVVAQSLVISLAELRFVYTWRTWIFGWLLRLAAQVSYFALMGDLVSGSVEAVRFILVGNVVVLTCLEATIVIISVANERVTGTLPLLVVSPSSHVPIYLGRGVQWLATGFASSTITLLVVPSLVGVAIAPADVLRVLPLLALVGVSSYCYGCFLAGIGLRKPGLNWVLLNVSYIVVMTFCGVNVPVSFWPEPIEYLAHALPVTHGLTAVRAVLDGAEIGEVVRFAGLELLVGAFWLLLAVLFVDRLVSKGRHDGSIDHGN